MIARMMFRLVSGLLAALLLAGCALVSPSAESAVTEETDSPVSAANIILVIGDGLGYEHVRGASFFLKDDADALSFHDLPHRAELRTDSASVFVTDSAAAGTAIATGVRVYNGVISEERPGDGEPLETILEYHQAAGKASGLVSTASITHATPAAFAAHTRSRGNVNEIAADYFTETQPDLLFGGGAEGVTRELAESAGYRVVRNLEELEALPLDELQRVSGQFGEGHMPYVVDGRGELPGLLAMTRTAVRLLSNDSEGFFLMVEAARIDHASHDNDLERAIHETVEMAETVAWLDDWAQTNGDTLLVVTSDHETGGLQVESSGGVGELPEARWSTRRHTRAEVPVYASGVDAAGLEGAMDNTELYWLLR